MRVGAFEIDEPLPELHSPHAFAVLRPWVDVGGVGSLTANTLENTFNSRPVGRLARPGNFIDFTRYRPVIRLISNQRSVAIPNSYIDLAVQPDGNDLVFFHLLEPHMFGETYAESLLKVLQLFGIERYCLIGGMYDAVPHTRPLLVSGTASGELWEKLHAMGVQRSDYEGPTTIAILVSQEAAEHNIETMSLIVHLPQYAQLDEHHAGYLRLLEIICPLYNFSINLDEIKRKAEKQYEKLNKAMERERQFEQAVKQLETLYEARVNQVNEEVPKLSPEIERFLREIDQGFSQN